MADALGKRRVAGVVVERGYPRMAGSGVIAGEVGRRPVAGDLASQRTQGPLGGPGAAFFQVAGAEGRDPTPDHGASSRESRGHFVHEDLPRHVAAHLLQPMRRSWHRVDHKRMRRVSRQ